jgi:predicted RND superfamily exporter protein
MNLQIKLHELVVSFFSRLAHHAIGHPRRVLVIAALVTLAAAPGVRWLKLRTDGHALVSQSAPEVVFDKAIRSRFGIEDNLVVLIQADSADGIFNPATLQLVRDLTAEFLKLPGINPSNVMSLATEPSFRLRPGSLNHQTLLEPPLKTKAELDQLREDLRRIELYTGTFVSRDGRSTCILIGAPNRGDRTQLYENVLAVIAARGPAAEDIAVTGAPVAESLLGIHILEDLGVPKALLGTSTRSHAEKAGWKMPRSFYELRVLVARRIGLVPVVMLVMMLIFFATFRNILATLLPVPEVVATLLFVFGLMGWLGVPVYLTIAVMPVLLTAMCVTDEIHVFSRYFALLREQPGVNHVELVKQTVEEMVCPVANTTLTTAIGFVSFAFSPLGPVQAFGIFTAVGVLFSLFYSLTVIPAMLTLLKPERLLSRRRRVAEGGPGWLAAGFARLALAVVRHRYWVVGLLLVVTALTPLGLRRLVVQDSWIDGFDPDSEFRRATQLVNEQFYGMHLLFVSVDQPQVLRGQVLASAMNRDGVVLRGGLVEHPALIAGSAITLSAAGGARPVGDRAEGSGAARGPLSHGASNRPPRAVLQSHIEMVYGLGTNIGTRIPSRDTPTNFFEEFSRAGRADFEVVVHTQVRPETIHILADLAAFIRQRRQYAVGGVLSPYDYLETTRFMARPSDPNARHLPDDPAEIRLMWDYYGLALGQTRLRQIVDTNYWQSLTMVFLKNANFIDTAKLLRDLRAYEREHLAPKGIKLGFAGDVAVSQSLIKGIVTTQLQSLVWSLVGIYVVTAIFGRSLRWGIYCVLPSTLAVLINFAVMGWFNIPLGVATSMFAGMTLGIGVDFAIHVVEGYGLARAAGATQTEALTRSMAVTGPPVLVNTIAITFGFGVLMLSQVPANARLGLLTVLGLVDCLIASLLLLPVLLHWWPLKDPREGKCG